MYLDAMNGLNRCDFDYRFDSHLLTQKVIIGRYAQLSGVYAKRGAIGNKILLKTHVMLILKLQGNCFCDPISF